MNGYDYILTKQINWAKRNKIKLIGSKINRGRKAYTETIEKNLFEPLLPETKKEFERGDGGELKSKSTQSSKMCAVHSSSAISVNVLQYWNNRHLPDLAYSLGLCRRNNKSAIEIHFEQKYKISNKFNIDPNIDAVILNKKNSQIKVLGIECKFSEAYSSRNHQGLKEKYLTDIPGLWKDIPNLFQFSKTISPNDSSFNYLHPAQLIKHILGLKRKYNKSGFRLLYLWYDVLGVEGYEHRKEIEEFTRITMLDNINFHSISYQELIFRLNDSFYVGNEKYIDYLTRRYL